MTCLNNETKAHDREKGVHEEEAKRMYKRKKQGCPAGMRIVGVSNMLSATTPSTNNLLGFLL